MSPSWISHSKDVQDKQDIPVTMSKNQPHGYFHHSKRFWTILCIILFLIAIGLGVGLGVGLTQNSSSSPSSESGNSASPTSTPTSTPSPTPPTNGSTHGSIWKPTAGTTWQIVLLYALNDTSPNVSVYDIDLFNNPTSTIDELHAQNRKVICYFSAGSYESYRPDSANFTSQDKGQELDGWPGEYWLDTKSTNVRNIMKARIALAASKGCDGVDPDNVDAYDNDNGLSLTTTDAIDYVTFLANEAHALNLSIGLKNGGTIVNETIDVMEWEVNEQCVQYDECDVFRAFIEDNKPVFHIEYPDTAPAISSSTRSNICGNPSTQGFSTILKDMDLDDFIETC